MPADFFRIKILESFQKVTPQRLRRYFFGLKSLLLDSHFKERAAIESEYRRWFPLKASELSVWAAQEEIISAIWTPDGDVRDYVFVVIAGNRFVFIRSKLLREELIGVKSFANLPGEWQLFKVKENI